MKAYNYLKYIKLNNAAILLFIILLIQACSSTKFIGEDESIVKKVTIDSLDYKFKEQALNYIQKDLRPASPFSIYVPMYNLVNTKDGKYKTNNIRAFGTPPTILDSTLVDISQTQIKKFLISKGYFNAAVTSDIKVKDKKAKVKFIAKPGAAYFVNNIKESITDKHLDSIYNANKASVSHLNIGMQYDEDSLSYERDQLYKLYRSNGYFYFLRPYVTFDVDTNLNLNKTNLSLNISNPIGKNSHQQYFIGDTHFIIAPSSEGFPDSIRYKLKKDTLNGIIYTDFSKRYRRTPIVRYDYLKKGELYDVRNENLTFDRLYELNVFKNVKIDFTHQDSSSNIINPVIQLTPQKVMSNRVEGELPFNSGTVGFTLSNTYTNNNLFRGAERFELQVKGGLQSRLTEGASLFKDIYQRDFSLSASISVPRLLIPFYKPRLGRNGMPHTTFSSSYIYALQKDVLVRRIFMNSISYTWAETKSKYHTLTPLNLEYRLGILNESIKNDPTNNFYYSEVLDRKDFTMGIKYTYTLNADKLNQFKNFIYLRASNDMAGNLLQAISKLGGAHNDPANGKYARILGVPFTQYVRPEVDLRWYKYFSGDRQFIARLNTGIGYAYGNSAGLTVPYEKLFFAGGSNGVRAWQARTIGPGNYNREVLANDELRRKNYGFDQLGDMRIEANFEYRYRLLNKFFGGVLKGATFIDMGNVWKIVRSPGDDFAEEKMFKFKNMAQQVAIGAGLGLRYDVQYFIFRFDIGLKLKDPQFTGSDQWVINKFLSGEGGAFKANYNATHGPDNYRFVQYNFGIGLPF